MYIKLSILLFSLVLPILALRFYHSLVSAILSDLRPLRILHYVTLALLGAVLFFKVDNTGIIQSQLLHDLLPLVLFAVALTYAAVFAIVTNNMEDLESDKVSNPLRPLVQEKVNKKQYLFAGCFCLIWSLCIAYFLGTFILAGLLLISLNYFLYSCKPFRLKRIPLVAKFIIGLNSLLATWCGFLLMGGSINQFPVEWTWFILLPLSLAANFVDLKDTEGDKIVGVKTLPVLLGEKGARLFISLSTLATYAMAAFILDIRIVYLLSFLLAALHCYLLYRKPYREKPVFLVYITSIWGLIVFLFFYDQMSAL